MIQIFLPCVPQSIRYRIEFVNPPTHDEAIRMEIILYEKRKGNREANTSWKVKPKIRFEKRI